MELRNILIEPNNEKQVKWWNRVGRHFVKVVRYEDMHDPITDELTGTKVVIKGLFSKYVARKCTEFVRGSRQG